MSNVQLAARSALDQAKSESRSLVTIDVVEGLSVVWIAARKGQANAVSSRVSEIHGVTLPKNPRLISSRTGIDFVGVGPDQWLAIAPTTTGTDTGTDLANVLASQLDGIASVVNQTDARTLIRISGEKARDTLAKGLPIDLHPRAFQEGAAAITHAAHIGVVIWRPLGTDAFILACSRSYSESFWRWLKESAAEHGLVVN